MTLTVLGCDGSWPGPGGAGSGYLVRAGGTSIVVDLGPGAFAILQTVADPADVDAVVVTHHHTDHWADLWALDTRARQVPAGRPVPVYAPAEVQARASVHATPMLDWRAVADGAAVEIGDLSVAFHRTDHAGETLAVRIDGEGRALGYSADTGPAWDLTTLGMGLDLLLCEATYTAEHEGEARHLSARQAGDRARQAGARRLVLTHRWPTVDAGAVVAEAAVAFRGPVEQAAIGEEYAL